MDGTVMSDADVFAATPSLYKYRSLRGLSRLHAERLLVHNEIYFASPASFNDPFDCQVRISMGGSDDSHRENLRGLFDRFKPELPPEQVEQQVDAIIKQGVHRKPEVLERVTKDLQKEVNGLGVFCMTAKPNDILMWSHYADGHAGFCVKFRHHNEPFLGRSQPVVYREQYPRAVYLEDSSYEQFEKVVLTKAEFWGYEQEWRVLEIKSGPGVYSLPPELLCGVILGYRMSPEDRRQVREWVEGRDPASVVYEARLKKDKFGLDIVAI